MMRRLVIIAALLAALGAAGWFAWQRYAIYLPGMIGQWREPVGPNRPVTWAKGPATPQPGDRPPNVILIVADDLGINDISLDGGGIGGGIVKTPNIDALAQQGLRFDTAYAGNATCSPSRAALMTGRYPTRFGFEFTSVPQAFASNVAHGARDAPVPIIYHGDKAKGMLPYPEQGLPAGEITIAEALKARGYHTMHIGKWHLGEAPALRPTAQGFDESLGYRAGGDFFMAPDDPDVVNAKLPWDPIDRFLWANLPYAVYWNNEPRFRPKGHVTDYFTDQALAAIDANRNRPFFLYLSYNAPHTPLQARRQDYDALPQIKDHTTRVYGAMVRQMDRRIGDVMARLKALGLDDNTLVIFTSDNGGAWYTGIPRLNAPYRGWKATFFEGGIRVPLFMRWPARLAPGSRREMQAAHIDLFPTIAGIAGAAVPQDRTIDGIDLLAEKPAAREALYWRSGDYRAVRAGDWKLQITKRPEKAYLYNLATDPTEQVNLASREPARVAALRAMIERQNAAMAPPAWPGLIEAPVRVDVPLNAPWQPGQEYVYWTN